MVICAGMGWRAAEALKQAGVREIVVTAPDPRRGTGPSLFEGRTDRHRHRLLPLQPLEVNPWGLLLPATSPFP